MVTPEEKDVFYDATDETFQEATEEIFHEVEELPAVTLRDFKIESDD